MSILEKLIAEARVAQSDLAWLGGFITVTISDRPDLPKRVDNAYNVIQSLVEYIEAEDGSNV